MPHSEIGSGRAHSGQGEVGPSHRAMACQTRGLSHYEMSSEAIGKNSVSDDERPAGQFKAHGNGRERHVPDPEDEGHARQMGGSMGRRTLGRHGSAIRRAPDCTRQRCLQGQHSQTDGRGRPMVERQVGQNAGHPEAASSQPGLQPIARVFAEVRSRCQPQRHLRTASDRWIRDPRLAHSQERHRRARSHSWMCWM